MPIVGQGAQAPATGGQGAPTITEMSHGFDGKGVGAYLEEIKSIVLTKASEAVRDISEIETACNANWTGESKNNFIEQLKETSEHVAQQYTTLYNILTSEITGLANEMKHFDQNLLK